MRFSFLFSILLFTATTHAQTLKFDQIDQSDLDAISKDLTATFTHSTVSGASSLGDVFGFEIGLIGGTTKTPEIDKRVKEVDPGASAGQLPNAVLLGQISVPFGFTFEMTYFPAVGSDSFKYSNTGLGIKWTVPDMVLDLPVDLAAKINYTTTNMSFKQTINNASTGNMPVDSTIESKNNILAYGVFVSKSFVIVEPYFGITFINGKSDLSVTGTGTIFDSAYTSGQSGSSTTTGTMMTLGVDFDLAILKLGAEYGSILGTSRFLGKLGFGF